MALNIATQRPLARSALADNLGASGVIGSFPVAGRRLSIQAAWTGTPVGTFALECSFDGGATWTTVPGAAAEFTANGQAQPAGGASSAVWNWSNVPGNMVRLLYTRSSGTGTATVRASQGS